MSEISEVRYKRIKQHVKIIDKLQEQNSRSLLRGLTICASYNAHVNDSKYRLLDSRIFFFLFTLSHLLRRSHGTWKFSPLLFFFAVNHADNGDAILLQYFPPHPPLREENDVIKMC